MATREQGHHTVSNLDGFAHFFHSGLPPKGSSLGKSGHTEFFLGLETTNSTNPARSCGPPWTLGR